MAVTCADDSISGMIAASAAIRGPITQTNCATVDNSIHVSDNLAASNNVTSKSSCSKD